MKMIEKSNVPGVHLLLFCKFFSILAAVSLAASTFSCLPFTGFWYDTISALIALRIVISLKHLSFIKLFIEGRHTYLKNFWKIG